VLIHSVEDLILYNLMNFGLSQQWKNSRGIAAILKSKKNELDIGYIDGWATRMGLDSVWREMLDSNSRNPARSRFQAYALQITGCLRCVGRFHIHIV
jgi:hypothetical protein